MIRVTCPHCHATLHAHDADAEKDLAALVVPNAALGSQRRTDMGEHDQPFPARRTSPGRRR
jgi:hypothetical protein